jgi:hypothetical protein
MSNKLKLLYLIVCVSCHQLAVAHDYYVHPELGDNSNTGFSKSVPLKTLASISKIKLLPGDRVLLASNQYYKTGIRLINQNGTENNPITITTINWDTDISSNPAIINFKGEANGILIQDCSFIEVSNIWVTGDGFFKNSGQKSKMRCGVLVINTHSRKMMNITIKNITVFDVFYENNGFTRGKNEVKTANGTQKYGWGIRVINKNPKTSIDLVNIENCHIKNVAHTGIKLSGNNKNITQVKISGNKVEGTGGPGIQMSGVNNTTVVNNFVTHSGSHDDTRKWGRGSGLWTWGASNVLIEKNKFLYANGPGDSAGAHIDFNCNNIVLQYNISAYNAGGFCEILGNNYNCIYRYNISVNDGYRVKGVNGAFQEGKILWLSGYQGTNKKRKGPVNSYIYNNTIYCDSSIVAKIAIDNTSNGVLIANNIFHILGSTKAVLGDQYKPDTVEDILAKNVLFKNNLFLRESSWSAEISIKDTEPIFGNSNFTNAGGLEAKDYLPKNSYLVKNKGIYIELLSNDSNGLLESLSLKEDILGTPILDIPSIGALEFKE